MKLWQKIKVAATLLFGRPSIPAIDEMIRKPSEACEQTQQRKAEEHLNNLYGALVWMPDFIKDDPKPTLPLNEHASIAPTLINSEDLIREKLMPLMRAYANKRIDEMDDFEIPLPNEVYPEQQKIIVQPRTRYAIITPKVIGSVSLTPELFHMMEKDSEGTLTNIFAETLKGCAIDILRLQCLIKAEEVNPLNHGNMEFNGQTTDATKYKKKMKWSVNNTPPSEEPVTVGRGSTQPFSMIVVPSTIIVECISKMATPIYNELERLRLEKYSD